MHLRNSWTRSMSSWYMTQSAFALGLKGRIFLFTSKFQETSVTRSRISGNALRGATVIVSEGSKSSRRDLHIKRGFPFTSALHDPHLAALQFQRQARSGARVRW